MKFKTIDEVERFKGKKLQEALPEMTDVEYTEEETAAILEEAGKYRVHTWCRLENVTGYTYHEDGDVVGDYVSPFREDQIVVCDKHFCGVTGAQGKIVSMYEFLLLADGVKAVGNYSAGGDEWDADGTRYAELI
ncbi:MAG: hypothetical protein LUG86_04005 [Oscillospiraceae bacterium]|nr:hypothetical protein [Oscillospiraceae bacterium]